MGIFMGYVYIYIYNGLLMWIQRDIMSHQPYAECNGIIRLWWGSTFEIDVIKINID